MGYANLNAVIPTGRFAGYGLQRVVSGLVAVEYLWSENYSIVAHLTISRRLSMESARTGLIMA